MIALLWRKVPAVAVVAVAVATAKAHGASPSNPAYELSFSVMEHGKEIEVAVRETTTVLRGMEWWVRGRSWEEEVAFEELVACRLQMWRRRELGTAMGKRRGQGRDRLVARGEAERRPWGPPTRGQDSGGAQHAAVQHDRKIAVYHAREVAAQHAAVKHAREAAVLAPITHAARCKPARPRGRREAAVQLAREVAAQHARETGTAAAQHARFAAVPARTRGRRTRPSMHERVPNSRSLECSKQETLHTEPSYIPSWERHIVAVCFAVLFRGVAFAPCKSSPAPGCRVAPYSAGTENNLMLYSVEVSS
jgi:hypothetical protein